MTEPQKLTPSDPVDAETLEKFNQLETARYELAIRLLAIEQEKVRILAATHQVDQQKQRLFEQVLIDRGLAPTTQVDIDATSGVLKVKTEAKS